MLLYRLTALATMVVPALAAATPIEEHVYGGLPSEGVPIERAAYVLEYDHEHKAPRWVAYHLVPEYRLVPPRESPFEDYRPDPDLDGEPTSADWAGAFQDPIRGYARGHLAPYFIGGGDRDGDGSTAEGGDADDAQTVFELNYFSNLTPQAHSAFNGAGGAWYEVETRIREELLAEHGELWVFAGPIFGPGTYDTIGDGVEVAPLFFQIVIWEAAETPRWEAYLLPHHQVEHGEASDYLVSVRHIEALSGLDFFSDMDLDDRERLSTYEEP